MNRVSKVLVVVVLMLLMIVPLAGAQEQSIVEIAVNDGRFDTLVAAVVAAELDGALSGGEWTVFAPTDEAFSKLPEGLVDELIAILWFGNYVAAGCGDARRLHEPLRTRSCVGVRPDPGNEVVLSDEEFEAVVVDRRRRDVVRAPVDRDPERDDEAAKGDTAEKEDDEVVNDPQLRRAIEYLEEELQRRKAKEQRA